MKKELLFVMLLSITVFVFSFDLDHSAEIIKDTYLYKWTDQTLNQLESISLDTKVIIEDIEASLFTEYFGEIEDEVLARLKGYDAESYVLIRDLKSKDQRKLFESSFLSTRKRNIWIKEYYLKVLYSKERENIFTYEKWWRDEWEPDVYEGPFEWYEDLERNYAKYLFWNPLLNNGSDTFYHVKEVESFQSGYIVTCNGVTPGMAQYYNGKRGYSYNSLDYKGIIGREEWKFILSIDGDYMDMYLDSKDNLLGTYVKVDAAVIEEWVKLLRTNICDLSNVTWPRRADGSSDYDDRVILRQSIGSSYRTTDNLRLRSAEETTSDILTTLEKGTKVIVKELGKQQTIDGITANWVKVSLEDRIEGWCFGGYLVEVPVEMKAPSPAHTDKVKDTTHVENGEKDIPDETSGDISGSAFPLLPVAGGVILVVVIALIVVIAKRRKR